MCVGYNGVIPVIVSQNSMSPISSLFKQNFRDHLGSVRNTLEGLALGGHSQWKGVWDVPRS